MNTIKKWVIATRLETIPLTLASVGLDSALAVFTGTFGWPIAILAAMMASLLQIKMASRRSVDSE